MKKKKHLPKEPQVEITDAQTQNTRSTFIRNYAPKTIIQSNRSIRRTRGSISIQAVAGPVTRAAVGICGR